MAKLYPPVIEGTIPAFNGTTLVVPFSMNRSVSVNQISGFAVKIKTVQSSTWIATLTNGTLNEDGSVSAVFEIDTDLWKPTPGQYYKLQLAYINNNEVGYYSTVGVVKYTKINGINNLQLLSGETNLLDNKSMIYPFKYTYTGVYDYSDDPMEKAYNYRFCIYNEADEIIQDSGILLHNATQDTLNTSADAYTFLDDLDDNKTFYLQYSITTVNGLQLVTPKIPIVMAEELVVSTNITLTAKDNFDNGYVGLTAEGEKNIDGIENYVSGRFKIYRQDVNYTKRWEPIFTFVLQNEQPSTYTWRDFTVEHNKTYKYKLCQFNENGILATINITNEVYVDFEDMFLFDGERQLKIEYNPKVSSFKNDILESKLDTIGSQYPFFFRNGHVHYKEFPISGLISYWSDNEELFLPLSSMGIDDITNWKRAEASSDDANIDVIKPDSKEYIIKAKTTNLTNYNIAAERQFKLDVLEWLTNGKPKLFRSPVEGNYIVRLMNTSLTPNDTVGRMLHTFSCTAYEIDDCTYDNLGTYGFVSGEVAMNDIKRLRFRTVYLRDIIPTDEEIAFGTNIYSYDENGYIEVLINPYGNHARLIAQSMRIEDCEYGDKFKINGEMITIGATQTYNIDGAFSINSIKFKPSEIGALKNNNLENDYTNTVYNPMVTYSYYDTFNGVALFDNVTDILVGSVPARQFLKDNNTMYKDNIVNEIEDIKTTVVQYNQILLELRPIEEVYTIIDLSTSGSFSSWFHDEGIPYDNLNSLFTFDKNGWGRGRSSMSGAVINAGMNKVSSSDVAATLKQMPMYIFKVLPTTVLSTTIAENFRIYRSKIFLAADSIGITITDSDLINNTAEELIARFASNPEIQRNIENAIINFKALQAENPLTIGGFMQTQTKQYVLSEDEERNPNKTYFLKTSTVEDNGNIYNTYIEYTGDFPVEEELYEYTDIWVVEDDILRDLYINLDYDKFTYDKEYYFYYDKQTDRFKMFDDGEFCTKVYFNTGELDGLTCDANGIPVAENYVDVAASVQPELYLRIDKLTDMYIGNAVMATLGYTYSTTTYKFESEQQISKLKTTYLNAVKRYNSDIKNRSNPTYYDKSTGAGFGYKDYDDTSLSMPDPTEWPSVKGRNAHNVYIKAAYRNFINALSARIVEWREANEGNGL